jgi:hypothetical protein
MHAARSQPTAVKPLLEHIVTLPEEVRIKILTQTDSWGSNALMYAERYQQRYQPGAYERLARLAAVTNYQVKTHRFGFQAENLEGKSVEEIERITPDVWMYVWRLFCEFIVACCNKILGNNSSSTNSPNTV